MLLSVACHLSSPLASCVPINTRPKQVPSLAGTRRQTVCTGSNWTLCKSGALVEMGQLAMELSFPSPSAAAPRVTLTLTNHQAWLHLGAFHHFRPVFVSSFNQASPTRSLESRLVGSLSVKDANKTRLIILFTRTRTTRRQVNGLKLTRATSY